MFRTAQGIFYIEAAHFILHQIPKVPEFSHMKTKVKFSRSFPSCVSVDTLVDIFRQKNKVELKRSFNTCLLNKQRHKSITSKQITDTDKKKPSENEKITNYIFCCCLKETNVPFKVISWRTRSYHQHG